MILCPAGQRGDAMQLPRRKFLHPAAGAAGLPALSRVARAQSYPTRPVRIIVGYPPDGSADVIARLIGQDLSERLGRPFVVENRSGAGTNIATEAVVKAVPDGYTHVARARHRVQSAIVARWAAPSCRRNDGG
jgi:tripartite-type tricarboxylate transporter receptor subunit TctC